MISQKPNQLKHTKNMIDYSQIPNSNVDIKYDSSNLIADGYKLNFALNPNNPAYQQVLDKCKEQNLQYKLIDTENKQKHIWIKGWKSE